MYCSEVDCLGSIVALSTVSESIVTVFYVAKSIVLKSIERVHCSVVFSYRAIGAESLLARQIVAGSIERCLLLLIPMLRDTLLRKPFSRGPFL